ncbi:hypothetical protein CALCODRAFT_63759 [Calocera cornea HHB12733]|uniref:Uncharacterized protein n=1 Tax=Calocera cornea HHB12733 TaxID=1353952 RepID=A0A165DLH9_9BASI|nr:hypothetical protein CALCODRAFT_63759 [Calocera cornea HHB12733]
MGRLSWHITSLHVPSPSVAIIHVRMDFPAGRWSGKRKVWALRSGHALCKFRNAMTRLVITMAWGGAAVDRLRPPRCHQTPTSAAPGRPNGRSPRPSACHTSYRRTAGARGSSLQGKARDTVAIGLLHGNSMNSTATDDSKLPRGLGAAEGPPEHYDCTVLYVNAVLSARSDACERY